jgi:hypothetical protein
LLASEQPNPEPISGDVPGSVPLWERIAAAYQERSRGLASLLEFRPAGEGAEIVTPFLDPANSKISLFVQLQEGGYLLCDGGLASRLVVMAKRPDGPDILNAVLRDYGLSRAGEYVRVEAAEPELPSKQFRMCSAIIALMDRLRALPHVW